MKKIGYDNINCIMKGEITAMADPAPDGNMTSSPSFWKSLSKRLSDRRKDVTEEDIRELVDAGEEKGVIEESQKDMINNIFEFGELTAEEIMTPRTEVEALDVEDTVQDALRIGVEEGFSRMPVYEEDIDHVIGILYIKDLLPYVGRALPAELSLRSLIRDAHFVPGTKNCQDLLTEMTEKHIQLAMVVDEYGGLAGIVSMEDLLESIVGSIQDEYDHEEEEVKQRGDNSFEIDGSMAIDEVGELLGIAFPEGDYETLAGFFIDQLGHIPSADEAATVVYGDLEFTPLKMDGRRVELIHIRRQDPASLPEPTEES